MKYERAFDIIDRNKNGRVNVKELQLAFKKRYGDDPFFDEKEYKEIIDKYDKNGKLQLQEFKRFWGEVASAYAMDPEPGKGSKKSARV